GPPFVGGEAAYYLSVNRGKRSCALDLSQPEGRELALELCAGADAVIENFKGGGADRLGVGYEAVRARNPKVVYCSITGFGQSGPLAHRPGYDFIFQGMGGLMSITGERDDRPGGGPQKAGIPIADLITGMYASIAVCAALAHRAKSGQGQHLDLALLDSLVAVLANQGANYLATGEPPARLGNDHPNITPYQVFKVADGAVIVACGNDNLFGKFCEVTGRRALAADARFATNAKRLANRAELTRILSEVMLKRSMRNWLAALEAAGVPCGPINTIDKVFADPQVQHLGIAQPIDHPKYGPQKVVGQPIHLSRYPQPEKLKHTPEPGEHTDEILKG
ncbi:MAG: CaiB/BaiF CoA transferase family protein, partial [Burkholderiales bacterium]